MIVQQTRLVEQREKRLTDTKKQIENEKAALKRKEDDSYLQKKQKERDVEILKLNIEGCLFMTLKMTLTLTIVYMQLMNLLEFKLRDELDDKTKVIPQLVI
ncbi:MAG: hypothetical protein EZS28_023402 [Streblomastix strix]|uniref:Uncharacterized protein n=1 Tax=Streblomastix strix TaxID=222440 RepID=A0A5J4VEP2_9EUKA|nr:MAG: hypothetical protein EZS28_023402 [Streblomastix strix]